MRFGLSCVLEVELTLPLSEVVLADVTPEIDRVLIVARLCGQPLGMATVGREVFESLERLARALQEQLASELARRAPEHGLRVPKIVPGGLSHDPCPVRQRLCVARELGPAVSVVVCTRERPDSLGRCLDSILRTKHTRYEVIVVDNAPITEATRLACAARVGGSTPLHYIREMTPGLSRARNAGIRWARNEIVAFVDDDERVADCWLEAIAAEFASDPRIGGVSGPVLPAELCTPAQVEFEQFGGHRKGRGFDRIVYDPLYLRSRQSAMYPLPPFGVGANMAFRKIALEQIGGFDVALGAGTRTKGGEDTLAMSEVLLGGWTMVYAPDIITWHYHRRERDALVAQLSGYGVGLGAYYTALVARDPLRMWKLACLAPRAVRDLRDPKSERNAGLEELPPEVARANLHGMHMGPFIYARERVASRRTTSRSRPWTRARFRIPA